MTTYNDFNRAPSGYQRARDFVDEFLEKHPERHDNVINLTGDELRDLILKDPDWIAKHATTEHPVVVTTYAYLHESGIRSLSPFITFRGVDWEGNDYQYSCADLGRNPDLKVAQGTFHGRVWFTGSGVREIDSENLKIFRVHPDQAATDFSECHKLHTARGTYPAGVDFGESAVEEIDTDPVTGLIITGTDRGTAACFNNCKDLRVLRGSFPGQVSVDLSGVETLAYDANDPKNPDKNLIFTRAGHDNVCLTASCCEELKRVKIRTPGRIILDESGVEHIDVFQPTRLATNALLDLTRCRQLKRISVEVLEEPLVKMTPEQRMQFIQILNREKAARDAMKKNPSLEL